MSFISTRVVGILLALTLPLHATPGQSVEPNRWADSARVLIERAHPAGDEPGLLAAIALLDRALTRTPKDGALLHYRGYALYRLAGQQLGMERPAEAMRTLDAADEALAASFRALSWPETPALRSAVLGMQITASNGSAIVSMRNGTRTGPLMESALTLGPRNPRVWLLHGSGLLYTPEKYGGGTDKAELALKKSIALLAADTTDSPAPGWGAADAHLLLGQLYARTGRKAEALAEYQTVLALSPAYAWVKYKLIPELTRSK